MKRIRISRRKSVTATILVLTVFFLAPVTALAGETDIQKSDTQKPGVQKSSIHQKLPKKMEIAPNKPGVQFNYLFKFEVPVDLKNIHPSVKRAYIKCQVWRSNRDISGGGEGQTLIPLQEGDYYGIINVYITETNEQAPELIDRYQCSLLLLGKFGGQIEEEPKFGTQFQGTVHGNLY